MRGGEGGAPVEGGSSVKVAAGGGRSGGTNEEGGAVPLWPALSEESYKLMEVADLC